MAKKKQTTVKKPKRKYSPLVFSTAQRIHADFRTLASIKKDNAEDSPRMVKDSRWLHRPEFYDYPGVDTIQRLPNPYLFKRLRDETLLGKAKTSKMKTIIADYMKGMTKAKIKKLKDDELKYYINRTSTMVGESYIEPEFAEYSEVMRKGEPDWESRNRLKSISDEWQKSLSKLQTLWLDLRTEQGKRQGKSLEQMNEETKEFYWKERQEFKRKLDEKYNKQ
jgi:hypothetical protein